MRYELENGQADKIVAVNKGQHRWIGAIAPRAPIRQHVEEGRNRGAAGGAERGSPPSTTAPVLIVACGRVLTAVDVGSGHHAVLLNASRPVSRLIVGDDGQQVRGDGDCMSGPVWMSARDSKRCGIKAPIIAGCGVRAPCGCFARFSAIGVRKTLRYFFRALTRASFVCYLLGDRLRLFDVLFVACVEAFISEQRTLSNRGMYTLHGHDSFGMVWF